MIHDNFYKISKFLRKQKKQESKPRPQKPKVKSMKCRELLESKGILLINQVKQVDSDLKEFEKLDFLSDAEEQSRIKLVIEREKLKSQIKILSWVLNG